jgi:Protein of unknown function (DUF3887)
MANVAEPSVCRMCGRALPRQQGRGRVRRYCSARCRDRARRRRADSTYRDLSFVKNDLTATRRPEIIDGDGDMSGVRDPVAAKVAEAAQQMVDELDHPGSPDGAVAAARNLSAAAEAGLQAAVDRARSAGQTWSDIGRVLGTSKQAAFQRFGHPVDPRTGVAMPRTVSPGATERAIAFLAHFTAGRWEEVLDDFDDGMRQRHDSDRLASGWAQMIAMFGSYEGMGDVSPFRVLDNTVVDVLLTFEAGEAMVWVRFDLDGKVTGLRLHPAPV